MTAGQRIETEVKIRIADSQTAQQLLERAGLQILAPRVFERNVIYDTADGTLRRQRSVLRLRRSGTTALLTFKGPATENRFKSREEIETRMSSHEAGEEILRRLGYLPVFIYEK